MNRSTKKAAVMFSKLKTQLLPYFIPQNSKIFLTPTL